MKLIKILLTIIIFSISINTNGQFLKKLKEKAKQKVEREAERRAQRRVDKKIDKVYDKAEEKIDETVTIDKNKDGEAVTSSKIFNFTHIYNMQMIDHKNKTIDFEYYLKNNVNYLAVNFPNMKNKMISIMDMDKGKNIMLMENGDQKTQMTMKFNFKSTVEEANKDITIEKTGASKKILGFTCYEYKVNGKDFNSNVWVTTEAGISFPKGFQGNGGKKMKNQNNNWMFDMDGMVLEMTIVDTSRKKPRTSTMICTKLAKETITIDTSAYKKMF